MNIQKRPRRLKKQRMLNTYVNNISEHELMKLIPEFVEEKKSACILEVNVDVIMKIEGDKRLREIARHADLVLADGKPLMWIAKMFGRPLKEKVSGSDLMPELCRLAAEKGYSIFILGGMGNVPKRAAANLQRQFPDLIVAGTYSPPFGFEKDPAECEKINAMLREAKPDILFACLGCPKQEKWFADQKDQFQVGVCLFAGASVDFVAGNVKRAPKFMSDHGLEWFFRFCMEPKRLFRRYFINDMKIFGLIFKYRKKMRHVIK